MKFSEFLSFSKKARRVRTLLLLGATPLLSLLSCSINVNANDLTGYFKTEVAAPKPSTIEENKKVYAMFQDLELCELPAKTTTTTKKGRVVADIGSLNKRKHALLKRGGGGYLPDYYGYSTKSETHHKGANEKSGQLLILSYSTFLDEKDITDFSKRLAKNVDKPNAPELPTPEIYKRIWDRTFSFLTLYGCLNEDYSPAFGISGGTAWLLDYAYSAKENKYKLFFATNAHVAQAVEEWGEFEPENYKYGNKKKSREKFYYFLGKTENPSFTSKNQLSKQTTSFYFGTPEKDYNLLHRLTKLREAKLHNVWSRAIKKPKVLYAAINFMNPDAVEQFQGIWKDHYNLLSERKRQRTGLPLPAIRKTKYYKDFAVLEYEVDMATVEESAKELQGDPLAVKEIQKFKKWVSDAVSEVARARDESARLSYTNKNNFSDTWWDFSDNLGAVSYYNTVKEESKKKNNKITEKFYHGGYPASNLLSKSGTDLDDYGMYWRHSEQNLIDSERLSRDENNNYIDLQPFFRATWFLNYKDQQLHSFGYTHYGMSGTDGGASGSLVTNKEGLPVSILWGGRGILDMDTWAYETDKIFIFDSFAQSSKVIEKKIEITLKEGEIRYNFVPEFIHHPYNLIDGTDRSRYPMQLTSYRGALNAVYPNGVFNDGNASTALFQNYLVEEEKEERGENEE